MIRTLTLAAGLAISASAAQAAFVGFDVVEGNSAGAAAFAGAGAITFQLFATFDAAGDGVVNTVLNWGDSFIDTVGTGTFFTVPGAAGGGITPPSVLFSTLVPQLAFMTFGTVGANRTDDFAGAGSNANADPSAAITSTMIRGGWLNGNPATQIGVALANANLSTGFGTLLANITISTPDANAAVANITSLISGQFTVFEQAPGGATAHTVIIPTPGSLALFGIAGLAATRRRR